MNKYETIIILKTEITKKQKSDVLNKIKKYITDNGKIEKEEYLGKRKLAYEVKKHNQGDYYIIEFESEQTAIQELERIYRITDEILKFIVVKKEC